MHLHIQTSRCIPLDVEVDLASDLAAQTWMSMRRPETVGVCVDVGVDRHGCRTCRC